MSDFEIPPAWFADVIAAGQAGYTVAGTVCTVAGVREIARRAVVAELRRLADAFDIAIQEMRKIEDADVPGLTLAMEQLRKKADRFTAQGDAR